MRGSFLGFRVGLPPGDGVMPGAGGTQRLMRAVGKFKAMKLVLTGEPIGAAEAERIGLVSEVVPDADVLPRALELAEKIAALPPLAVAQIKEVMAKSNRLGMKTFDQSLFELYESGVISYEDALRNADSKNEVRLRIKLESKRETKITDEAGNSLRIMDEETEGVIGR